MGTKIHTETHIVEKNATDIIKFDNVYLSCVIVVKLERVHAWGSEPPYYAHYPTEFDSVSWSVVSAHIKYGSVTLTDDEGTPLYNHGWFEQMLAQAKWLAEEYAKERIDALIALVD